jgi:UDP-glucose 4-epimerase
MRNEPITVYGDGTQTRTFIYVGDVVDAVTKLIECPDAIGELTNIGGAEEIAIGNLAERIKKLACSTSEIKLISYDEAYTKDFEDMQRRVPSIEKVEKLVNWKPTTNLDDILNKVIDYYRANE